VYTKKSKDHNELAATPPPGILILTGCPEFVTCITWSLLDLLKSFICQVCPGFTGHGVGLKHTLTSNTASPSLAREDS
jgi:hypothetical protein